MIKLYGGASPLFVHHVGDAIELWLAERARPELASVIRAAASEELDASVKTRKLDWAEGMSGAATSTSVVRNLHN
jgi:hypothetical protein